MNYIMKTSVPSNISWGSCPTKRHEQTVVSMYADIVVVVIEVVVVVVVFVNNT